MLGVTLSSHVCMLPSEADVWVRL